MANVTLTNGRFITVSGLDTDWSVPNDLPFYQKTGLKVKSIRYNPGTDTGDDVCIIYDGSHTSSDVPEIFKCTTDSDARDDRIQYYHGGTWMNPYFTSSDCTISAGSKITFELA